MIKRRACQGLWETLFYILAQAVKTWNAIDAAFELIFLIHDWMPYRLNFWNGGSETMRGANPRPSVRKYTCLIPPTDLYRKWVDTADCCPLLISSIHIS